VRRCIIAVAVLFAAVLTPGQAQAGSARAGAMATWSGFEDMVVDQSAGYVFISGTSSGVLVADPSGHAVGSISGLGHTEGMTLSVDGSTLFVTVPAKHEIVGVDATDPLNAGAVRTHDVGATCPVDVAMSAGLVWFADECQLQDPMALDYLDPGTDATGQAAVTAVPFAGVSSSPAIPGALFVSGDDSVARYDVTDGGTPTATLGATRRARAGTDLTFAPDGSEIVTDTANFLAPHTLKSLGSIRLGGGIAASATAVRASDGALAVASEHRTGHVPDEVGIYDEGSTDPFRTYAYPEDSLYVRSVAFGETDLYVVDQTKPGKYRLHVVVPRPQPTLEVLTDRTTYRFGQRATVTAVLGDGPAVQRVALYAKAAGHARYLLRRRTVDATGRLVTHMRMTRKTVFSAVVAGDDTVDGNTASVKVHVGVKMTGTFLRPAGHSGRYAVYRPGSSAYFVGRIQPRRGGCLSFEVQLKNSAGWTDASSKCFPAKRGRVEVRLPYKPAYRGHPMRIKVWWEGRGTVGGASRWYYLEFRA
jgi:hypothetical protein